MANIESKNLLVAVKSFARAQALPLDRDEVWESLSAAEEYMQSPTAYAGQTIKVLRENGKYYSYILQPSTSGTGLELEQAGGGSVDPSQFKQYVQVVTSLPESGQVQGIIYVNTTDNAGYIWVGSEYKQIFRDVETDISNLQKLEETKASLSGATFTGEVILAADPTQDLSAATKQYVDNLISNLFNVAPGVVDSNNPLPDSYKAGQSWRVTELGIYADTACEVGDLIIAVADGTEVIAENFIVVQANIEGAVTGPEEAIDATLVVFDGTTGKKLAGSNITIASVEEAIAMKHTHDNFDILNSFTKTQEELKAENDKLYTRVKYEISHKPDSAIVDYREKEIRVMCPSDTEWTQQNVGSTGNPNMYYMGFKAYAPEGAVSFKEGDRGVIVDEMFTFDDDFAGIDEFGRKYSICWLALASNNAGTWTYYGKTSTVDKYIGWTYCVEWYDENGKVIESDCIRINLSNENCHSELLPSYVSAVRKELRDEIDNKIESSELQAAIEDAIAQTRELLNSRIGDIPEETTIKQYIDTAIGSGGTSASEAIATAKSEAIAISKEYTNEQINLTLTSAKEYTDSALLIYEF